MNRNADRRDAAVQQAPLQMRMECPDCSEGIALSLPMLLLGRPVWCSGCGARLDIDLKASGDVLRRQRRTQHEREALAIAIGGVLEAVDQAGQRQAQAFDHRRLVRNQGRERHVVHALGVLALAHHRARQHQRHGHRFEPAGLGTRRTANTPPW